MVKCSNEQFRVLNVVKFKNKLPFKVFSAFLSMFRMKRPIINMENLLTDIYIKRCNFETQISQNHLPKITHNLKTIY